MSKSLRENIQNKKMVSETLKAQQKKTEEEQKAMKSVITKANQKPGTNVSGKDPISDFFEDQLYTELFNSRCHDTGESSTLENAKLFKEDLLKRNVKNSNALNLQSLRLGINSVIALSNGITTRKIEKLNLADNSISDYGMHAIKNILKNNKIKQLNLASNMISGEGLELFLDDLIDDKYLKTLDIGVVEGSMRKNSLGIQGAVCISAMLIRNKTLESLSINDNDLGADGGECIGIALSQNENLKILKVAENDLKSEGATPIIKSAGNLVQFSLAKNFLKSDIGKPLSKLLKTTKHLKKLQIEFNELMVPGAKWIAKGLL